MFLINSCGIIIASITIVLIVAELLWILAELLRGDE